MRVSRSSACSTTSLRQKLTLPILPRKGDGRIFCLFLPARKKTSLSSGILRRPGLPLRPPSRENPEPPAGPPFQPLDELSGAKRLAGARGLPDCFGLTVRNSSEPLGSREFVQ